jgi:hypothetical protein
MQGELGKLAKNVVGLQSPVKTSQSVRGGTSSTPLQRSRTQIDRRVALTSAESPAITRTVVDGNDRLGTHAHPRYRERSQRRSAMEEIDSKRTHLVFGWVA